MFISISPFSLVVVSLDAIFPNIFKPNFKKMVRNVNLRRNDAMFTRLLHRDRGNFCTVVTKTERSNINSSQKHLQIYIKNSKISPVTASQSHHQTTNRSISKKIVDSDRITSFRSSIALICFVASSIDFSRRSVVDSSLSFGKNRVEEPANRSRNLASSLIHISMVGEIFI